MKNFVIRFPKYNEDPKGSYKNYLLNKVFKKYPYLTDDATCSRFAPYNRDLSQDVLTELVKKRNISYAGPGDGFEFGKKNSLFDVNYCAKDYINGKYKQGDEGVRVYDLYSEFAHAMDKIDEYARYRNSNYAGRTSSADFYIGDNAVKVHSSYIQVNNVIIPRDAALLFFAALSAAARVEVYTVVVTVNKFVLL